MDPAPFAPEQSGTHRLADQRMPEGEHVDLVLDQQAGGDEPAQRVDQRRLGRPGDAREQIERHALAEHRRGLDDGALGFAQRHHGVTEQLGDGPRQRQIGEIGRTSVARRGDQLLEEERIAAAAVVQRLHGPVRHVVAEGLRREIGDLVETEPVEPDVQPVRTSFDRVQEGRQRRA